MDKYEQKITNYAKKNKKLITKYVYKSLKDTKTCSNILTTSSVKNILDNKFANGHDMSTVVCLFDALFNLVKKDVKKGLNYLSVDINKWIKKMDMIQANTVGGYVFMTDIVSSIHDNKETDIQVVIKTPRDLKYFDDMIIEYFIGVTEINKLRYLVPNFAYTLGAFICPWVDDKICDYNKKEAKLKKNQRPFVIFEKIKGKTVEDMLDGNKINFSQYLGIFIQLLLALEVGQRNIDFCHYDLHASNVMCRPIEKKYEYVVPLNDKEYDVTAVDILPIIIDFGTSTVVSKNKTIGSYDYIGHGMMNYMISGVDVFKFLINSLRYSKGETQLKILGLFAFYGDSDPYKIYEKGFDSLNDAIHEYGVKATFSAVATFTPLDYLHWILEQQKYNNIVSKYIKVKERGIYCPLCTSIVDQKQSIDQLEKIKSSYIMTSYFEHVFASRIIDVKSRELMIESDKMMINMYKNIRPLDVKQFRDKSSDILSIMISMRVWTRKEKNDLNNIIDDYMLTLDFFEKMLPYLQFLYTIRELKLEQTYKDYLQDFVGSLQYKTYSQNCDIASRTNRWCGVLYNSMKCC